LITSNVATTIGFGGRPDRPRVRLVSFRPVIKGSLRGFATVELPIGLTIFDCPVMFGRIEPWAVLTSKLVLDSEGRHVKPGGRKGQYVSVLLWRSKDRASRFSDSLFSLVTEAYPGALEE
jgi:hypothetical protein